MNEIRSILLHLDASAGSAQRLHAAHRLAKTLGAQLEVLYAVTPAVLQYPMAINADSQLAAMLATLDVETRERARVAFERECTAGNMPDVAWDESSDCPIPAFKRRAFETDLLVLAQLDADARPHAQVPPDFAASVLIETGKPALLLPHIHTGADIGRTVLIAWKDAPEAVHAVTAALPMLRRAQAVHVVAWDESDPTMPLHLLPVERFLSRHGISVTVHRMGPPTADLGELLLSMATDVQADLIVMGCYGHSRAREWLLGGATRTLLQSMTVPVLMAH